MTRPLAAVVVAVFLGGVAPQARAQDSQGLEPQENPDVRPPVAMTVMTSPPDARVLLRGSSEVSGVAPLELGPQWNGRYLVVVAAPGYATARGAMEFPQRGGRPTSRSEPPGLSGTILLKSLNFPGVPDLLSGNKERGLALLTAGIGGLGSAVRNQLQYHTNNKRTDVGSQDKAYDFHYARERWSIYAGGVWGLSALDYILRPRMRLLESNPTQVKLGTPRLTRSNVMWRSALVPGAGQEFANQRTRGMIWLSTTLLAGAAYFVADESHHRLLTKLHRAEVLLETATPSQIPALQADVIHFTNKERSSHDLLTGLGLATVGIHAANIIDAGMLPLHRSGSWKESSTSLSVPVRPGHVAIEITRRF